MINLLSSSAFYIVNKQLVKDLGFNAALLLSDLISKREYFEQQFVVHHGWFFNTEENIKRDTTLTGYQQRKATDILVKYNLIETELRGIPAKKHFKINEQTVLEFLENKKLKNLITINNNKLNKIIKQDSTNAMLSRKLIFEETVMQVHDVSNDLLEAFIDYWTEPNKSGTKMRFELQNTWELNLRLKNWCRNQKKWTNTASSGVSKLDQALSEYQKGKALL